MVGQREWEAGVAAVGRRLLSHVCRPMNQSRLFLGLAEKSSDGVLKSLTREGSRGA